MKPPTKVKVGSHTYEVIVSQPLCEVADVDYGVTYPHRTQILLHPNQSPSVLRDTALHETLHALFDDSGLSDYVNAPAGATVSKEQEELVIRHLTPALLRLLRDNPKLVAFLCAP